MINIFLITIIIVFIIDLSGIVNTIKEWLSLLLTKFKIRKTNYSLKPIDCSLCMTFWVNLIYIIWVNQFDLKHLLFICICAFITPIIKNILILLVDVINYVINKIENLL